MEPIGVCFDQVEVAFGQEGCPRLSSPGPPRDGSFAISCVMFERGIDHLSWIERPVALADERQTFRTGRLVIEAGWAWQVVRSQGDEVESQERHIHQRRSWLGHVPIDDSRQLTRSPQGVPRPEVTVTHDLVLPYLPATCPPAGVRTGIEPPHDLMETSQCVGERDHTFVGAEDGGPGSIRRLAIEPAQDFPPTIVDAEGLRREVEPVPAEMREQCVNRGRPRTCRLANRRPDPHRTDGTGQVFFGFSGRLDVGPVARGRALRCHQVNALRPVSCSPITNVWTSSVPS